MKRLASRFLLAVLLCLTAGCFVRAYVPRDAQLLTREGQHALWQAPEGFIVVSTFQVADSRNEVCLFATKRDAEEFFAAKLAGERTFIWGCACGSHGRVHRGDTYHDPAVSNERCEKALAESGAWPATQQSRPPGGG